MTKQQNSYQAGRHTPGQTIAARFSTWLTAAPVLSLVSCARCTTTQMLPRFLGSEVEKRLLCGHCGAPIATVARAARASWIELVGATLATFPTSPYPSANATGGR